MGDRLDLSDADGLRDFADRNERAAKTARRTAQLGYDLGSATDAQVVQMLAEFAASAEQASHLAVRIADQIEVLNG